MPSSPFQSVGEFSQGPSVSRDTPQYTAATNHVDVASPIRALGDSLSSFFTTAAQTEERIAQVDSDVQVQKIQRELQHLKLQGQIDYQAGRPMAPDYANRQAYAGAYQEASADNHVFQLTEKFKGVLNTLPRDGTQDPMAAAKDFWKSEVGTGTGDRDYDAQLMGRFTANVQQMVAQADNQKLQDQETTATNEIVQSFAGRLQSHNGVTPGDVADLRGKILTVTRGDVTKADHLIGVMASQVDNQRQGLSFLNSLAAPDGTGSDGNPTSWASRNAATYKQLSKQVLAQVTQVKSVEAYNEVSRWQQDVATAQADPTTTPAQWAGLVSRAVDIDYRHGTGTEPFQHIFPAMRAALKQKANVNLQFEAMRGTLGGAHDLASYEVAANREVTDREREQGYSLFVAQTPGFQALADSTQQSGVINPQASPQAMTEFAKLFASQDVQATHAGSLMTKDLKVRAFGPLTGNDPAKAAEAYRGAKLALQLGVSDSQLSQLFPSPDAEQMFRSMDAFMADGTDPVSAFKALHDDARYQKMLASASDSGKFDIAGVAGLNGPEASKLSQDIDQRLTKLGRELGGNTNLPFFKRDLGMTPTVRAQVMGLLYKDAVIQRSNGSSYDVDSAFKAVAGSLRGRYLTLPGMDGRLQLVENKFGDQGQNAQNPLNLSASGLIPTSKGYAPVYSGVPMRNKLGVIEDPQATMAEDIDALATKLPNAVPDSRGAWMTPPDANGLMTFKARNGQLVQFMPGQAINLPAPPRTGGDSTPLGTAEPGVEGLIDPHLQGDKEATGPTSQFVKAQVPADPAAADKFLQQNLPKGWFAIRDGYIDPMTGRQAYVLKYGFRLKGDDEAAKAAAVKAEAGIERRKVNSQRLSDALTFSPGINP